MKQTLLFRLWSIMTILLYSAALAQAGQVITQVDRSWAQEAVKHDAGLSAINTPNSIAVLDFTNKSGQEKLNPLQKGLAVMLIADLAKVEQLQVVERTRIRALLDEMDLGGTQAVEVKTIPKIGKLLGSYYVASGEFLKGKKQNIVFQSSILDTPFETVTKQPTVTGAMDEFFKLEKKVLFNIIDQLKIPVSPEKRKELKAPASTSTSALLSFFIGIDHSDKGQYVEAANMYKQALVEDPNFKMAKNALQEVQGMGQTSVEESSPATSAEDEGYSTTTVVGIGAAVAVLGGAAVFALSGSGGSDDDGAVEVPPVDGNSPTAIASPQAGSTLSCTSGSITFSFSEAMALSGQAVLSQAGFASSQGWQDLFYVLSWNHDATFCNGIDSLEVTLNGFQDSAGNALSGTVFTYSVAL